MKKILLFLAAACAVLSAPPPQFSWAVPRYNEGDVIADSGSFNNATIGNLTVTGTLDVPCAAGTLTTDAQGKVLCTSGSAGDVLTQTTGVNANFSGGGWDGGKYGLIGGAVMLTSATGVSETWDPRPNLPASTRGSLCITGRCVAFTSTTIYTSTDDSVWDAVSTQASTLNGISHDGTTWFVVGTNGKVVTSADGITWALQSPGFGAGLDVRGVASSGSVVVASTITGAIKSSADGGANWTSRTSGVSFALWNCTYDSAGTQFICVGNNAITTSPDGVTWTPQTVPASTDTLNMVTCLANCIAVGPHGVILTSPTGVTWTRRTSGVTTSLNMVTDNGTDFLAAGNSGVALLSTDGGLTWAQQSTGSGQVYEATLGTGPLIRQTGAAMINVDSGYFDKIALPTTTADGGSGALTAGFINIGSGRFLHSYAEPGSDGFNTFAGANAGNGLLGPDGGASSLGSYNTGIGALALNDLRTGRYNTAIGYRAGAVNTGGSQNLFAGAFAGNVNASGGNLVYLGYNAGQAGVSAANVVAVGAGAFAANTADFGVAVGSDACADNTTGAENVCVGYQSMANNLTGTDNVGVGSQTLIANTTGSELTATGTKALDGNIAGNGSVGVGTEAGYLQENGDDNTFVGRRAGRGNDGQHFTVDSVTGIGAYSLGSLDSLARYNTATGVLAGYSVSTGVGNQLYGFRSCDNITTGSRNLCFTYNGDAPSATASGQMNLGNIFYVTGLAAADTANNVSTTGLVGIGTNAPDQKLTVAGPNTTAYASSSGSLVTPAGGTYIKVQNTSDAANTFAGVLFVTRDGSNAIGYLDFVNTAGTSGSFVFGQRTGASSYAEQMRIGPTGVVTIQSLAGAGTRTVVADANGVLSAP